MKQQIDLIPLRFNQGERVEVMKHAPTNIYGFGRIECESNGRPGWYYVRYPQGELELVEWVYILRAPEDCNCQRLMCDTCNPIEGCTF